MMKKVVTFSLFIFTSGLIGVLIAGYLVAQQGQKSFGVAPSNVSKLGSAQQLAATSTAVNGQKSTEVTLSVSEVAKHSTPTNCWLVVTGKIYDVSGYLSKHPAGAGAIAPYCGKDATGAFTGSNGGRAHSSFAQGLLGKFYIGTIGQQTTAAAVQQGTQQAQDAAQQAPAGGREGDEEGNEGWEDDN